MFTCLSEVDKRVWRWIQSPTSRLTGSQQRESLYRVALGVQFLLLAVLQIHARLDHLCFGVRGRFHVLEHDDCIVKVAALDRELAVYVISIQLEPIVGERILSAKIALSTTCWRLARGVQASLNTSSINPWSMVLGCTYQ